jgi:hypothetical protein
MLTRSLKRIRSRWWVNGPLGRAWRGKVWPVAQPSDGIEVLHEARRDSFGSITASGVTDPAARALVERETQRWRFQCDRLIVAENARIDPRTGIAVLGTNKRVRETFGVHPELAPSLFRNLADSSGLTAHRRLPEAIHFDGFLGRNLWHFFQDALNGLLLVDSLQLVAKDVPILIGRSVWETPWARFVLERPPFATRNWLVLDREWLHVDRLYKGEAAFDWFAVVHDLLGEAVDRGGKRNIFVNRRPRFGRTLRNSDEIEAAMAARGFATVYPEDLTFEEQARLFAETNAIVAIHGAGLTNCLFSNIAQLRCLELQTADYINPHYFWLLEQLGVNRYDCLVGSPLQSGAFTIDPDRLHERLDALLS